MKKILFSAIALCSFMTMKAQLNDGMKAKDFTFNALNNNGQLVNLYSWLDSGKYVFLDVSATWCGPCWNYHQTKALKDLYIQHGPGSASNDVRVVFVEGDGSTDDTKMSGGTGSQGNWLLDSPYPMCNPATALANTFNDDYEIAYYPTVYMICPDRTVKEVGTLSAANLYAQVSPTPLCPAKINVDVAPVTFDGKLISCTGNYSFNLTLKNRGFNNLTGATINVKYGTTTLTTIPWTGNLTTYQSSATIPVNLTAVPANVDSLIFETIATGDQILDNNTIVVRIDNYSTSTAATLPLTQNFDTETRMPARFGYPDVTSQSKFGFYDGIAGTTKLMGAAGANTKAMFVNFYNVASGGTGIATIGNFNTTTTSNYLNLDFDMAYAQYQSENDKLEVVVSTDCGVTWTSKWTKSGTAMSTSAATTSSFIPSAANQWRHESVDLSSIKNNTNVIVGYRMTSAYGNYAWIDNINLKAGATPASVGNVDNASVDVYPNPTSSDLNVRGVTGNATFNFVDVLGRTIKTISLENINSEIKLNVSELTKGNYILKITNEGKSIVKSIVITE